MESFISRFKNENHSLLLDALTIEVLANVVNVRMYYYNDVRRHSALNNQPPRTFLERWPRDVDEDHKKGCSMLGTINYLRNGRRL